MDRVCKIGLATNNSNPLSADIIMYGLFLWQGVSDEESKTSPWTYIAKYKLMVEEELAKLEGYEIKSVTEYYGVTNYHPKTTRLLLYFPVHLFQIELCHC